MLLVPRELRDLSWFNYFADPLSSTTGEEHLKAEPSCASGGVPSGTPDLWAGGVLVLSELMCRAQEASSSEPHGAREHIQAFH